jgi:hypothetical protein
VPQQDTLPHDCKVREVQARKGGLQSSRLVRNSGIGFQGFEVNWKAGRVFLVQGAMSRGKMIKSVRMDGRTGFSCRVHSLRKPQALNDKGHFWVGHSFYKYAHR